MKASETTPLYTRQLAHRVCGLPVRRRELAVAIILAVVFLAVASKDAANNALPVILPALRTETAEPMVVSVLPGVGAIFYAAGKLSQIFVSHFLGATHGLFGVMLFGGLGMLLFALGDSAMLVIGWSVAQFAAAHTWGACTRLSAGWVDHAHHGRVFGVVFGVAGGGSSSVLLLVYSLMLDAGVGWRGPPLLSAGLFLAVAAITATAVRDAATEVGFRAPLPARDAGAEGAPPPHPLDDATLRAAVSSCAKSGRAWLTVLACGGYAVAWGGSLTYGPLYAVAQLGASEGDAARLTIAGTLGALCGALAGGFLRDAARGRGVFACALAIKSVGLAAAVLWLALDGGGAPSDALSLRFLGGIVFTIFLSIEFSWNVMISVFALRYGGPAHSSTLVGIQDVVSFSVKVPFLFAQGGLIEAGGAAGYTAVIVLVGLALAFAHACILAFLWADRDLEGAHIT